MISRILFSLGLVMLSFLSYANSIIIPMDEKQHDHLKAYGIAYKALEEGMEVSWLLNYRGGSFLVDYSQFVETECRLRGITFEVISDNTTNAILSSISAPEINQDVVKLEKAPRIAVYSPKNKQIENNTFQFSREADDAVILVLDYAEIPYSIVYDEEVLKGELVKYDWIHLHHEDFTGQFGRFTRRETDVVMQEDIARRMGYKKVSQMKLAVAKTIRDFTAGGGFLFAMCSGAETFDIALAAEGIDILDSGFDGDGVDPNAQGKLDFRKTFAFEDFVLETSGYTMEFSSINSAYGMGRGFNRNLGYFSLFGFSAKWDVIPTMLTQDHEYVIPSFFGQTTGFSSSTVKPSVLVMGEDIQDGAARYVYGEYGNGQWAFYSGHDPEGLGGGRGGPGGGGRFGGGRGQVRDLSLTPNSPGYRLILNNVLFPSARKKKRKT